MRAIRSNASWYILSLASSFDSFFPAVDGCCFSCCAGADAAFAAARAAKDIPVVDGAAAAAAAAAGVGAVAEAAAGDAVLCVSVPAALLLPPAAAAAAVLPDASDAAPAAAAASFSTSIGFASVSFADAGAAACTASIRFCACSSVCLLRTVRAHFSVNAIRSGSISTFRATV